MQRREHYEALDGLRGLAAISVLLFHLGHWQQQFWIARNAGLAVDFFFALSGYVLSLAYGRRLDQGMSAWAFMRVRFIRLGPIIVLGTLISTAYIVARVIVLHDAINISELVTAAVLGSLAIPMFGASRSIGGPQVFPLNGPEYTLFLELVANAFWAVTRRMESLWFSLAIAGLCYALTAVYGAAGDQASTFWTGFPRVFGAYYAGVAVFQIQRRLPAPMADRFAVWFWPLLLVTLALFFWPFGLPRWVAWIWSLAVSPLLVLTGSRVQLAAAPRRVALTLGALSYPVYALHYPIFVWVNGAYQFAFHGKNYVIGSAFVFPSVLLGGWIILRSFDEPARERLTSWTRRKSAGVSTA